MHHKVEVHELKDGDALGEAIAKLLWHCHHNGVQRVGEKATMIIPRMIVGQTKETALDLGEWEIVIRKVEE